MTIVETRACRARTSSGGSPTPAERETLRDLKLGLTDQEISRTRSVSVRVVRNQVSSLLRKSGLGSRTSLAKRKAEARDPKRSTRPPACSLCRKSGNEVTFVITDPANLNNVCASCADECVRVFARTCVC